MAWFGPLCAAVRSIAEPTMSRRTQETERTGWYYRVLKEGSVTAGDAMRVVDRPHPEWSVARVQHYLYVDLS